MKKAVSTQIKSDPAVAKRRHAGAFLPGKGEMHRLISQHDWGTSSLGPINKWSHSLRTAVGFMLQSPVPMVMLWGQSGFMLYNDAFSEFAGARHPALLGSTVLDGWPEVADFNQHVMDVVMAGGSLTYTDQPLILHRDGEPEEVWMDLTYSPLPDDSGASAGVLAIVHETTQRKRLETNKAAAEAALAAEREQLYSLLMQAPAMIAILKGPNHIFELANPLYMQLVGHRPLLGKPIREALPELDGQSAYESLDEAYITGIQYVAHERAIELDRSGKGDMQTGYFNFVYQPYLDTHGSVEGIMVHGVEVTDQVLSRQKNESVSREQQRLIALTNQRNELIKLNNAKDEFISLASHQLRTPATVVKQYVSLLLSGYGGETTVDQRKFLQIAYDNNERQLNIISDLLKTAQLDSSRYTLHPVLQPITPIVQTVINQMMASTELKKQVILFDDADDMTRVSIDSDEIALVISNLIENASKYSFIGQTITITLKRLNKYLDISVIDQGVGLDSTNATRIFDKFTRINNVLSDTVTGTGLGLYWVKKIIKLHHGTIRINSELGKGSTFIVRLPL